MAKLSLVFLAVVMLCVFSVFFQVERTKVSPVIRRATRAKEWPPLSRLIGDNERNITGNVGFLQDFAIVGHPKCATTHLNQWLADHPEIQMYKHEVYSIKNGKPAQFVMEMYNLPQGKKFKRGYKAPNDIRLAHSLYLLNKYWPNVHLIVGLRHPVLWFQSWYNFKTRGGHELGPAEDMVGKKLPFQVRFHNNLSQLGKTNVTDPSEALLLEPTKPRKEKRKTALFESDGFNPSHMTPLPQKVFLYVDLQLNDNNETRHAVFRRDLQTYLGLKQPLENTMEKEDVLASTNFTQINICADRYRQLRSELVHLGMAASQWIRTYFLPHPDVFVSSRDYFEEHLKSWTNDPCKLSHPFK